MKPLITLLSALAIPLGVFGYWGYFTYSGNKHFDEMDGLYPFFALLLSGFLFLIVLILIIISFFKKKK